MPNPSYYPLLVSLGLFIAAMGLLIENTMINPSLTIGLLHLPLLVPVGLLVTLVAVYGWAFEPAG